MRKLQPTVPRSMLINQHHEAEELTLPQLVKKFPTFIEPEDLL